ncbi:diguanylate cyclase domain-containing protein [Enterovibrio paralichthyis]|uniref:TackOD1 domain-containing metal-binding protein n=1 Tax=Enterovibrio paralichthyis TaxID=2853805 RepID=UPI0021081331|nr:diguanylate cyclase [Enterovibrio paralichthyis]
MAQSLPFFQLGVDATERYPAQFISDWRALPETPGIVVITDSAEQDALLEAMHRSQRFWQWRIYVSQPSALSAALSDGAHIPDNLESVWQDHRQYLAAIKNGESEPLLAWLWLDDERELQPVRDASSRGIYRYPLLEAYNEERATPYHALLQLTQRGYLVQGELVDKVRFCPSCQSGHLNYVETCPHCKGLDIRHEHSLHCFTCGHVADQEAFTRSGKLVCPNCLTQLRHIGVDYDRPLETYVCQSCKHRFSEAQTKARCLSCDTFSAPNTLIARQIYRFDTGMQTASLLRNGQTFQIPALSLNHLVDAPFLLSLLPWINKLARRHQQQHLILALHLPGLENYGQKHGELKTLSLTEHLSERLNGLLRDTDLCCQYTLDTLLLLMPQTPQAALGRLQEKITELASLIEVDDFTLQVYAWTLPDELMTDDAANWLVMKMSGQVDD